MGIFTTKSAKLKQFNTDYLNVKILVFKTLTDAAIAAGDDNETTLIRIAMDYALGEDILRVGPDATDPAKVKSLIADGPAKAKELMADEETRGLVIGVLAFKDKALTEYLGAEWTDTPEAARVRETLRGHDRKQAEELRQKIEAVALAMRRLPT